MPVFLPQGSGLLGGAAAFDIELYPDSGADMAQRAEVIAINSYFLSPVRSGRQFAQCAIDIQPELAERFAPIMKAD